MAAVTGLTLVHSFPYRGDTTEEFASHYHFKNPPPGDDASWTLVMNDAVNKEKQIYTTDVKYVRAYGYDSDDPHAHHVFAHDFTVPGPPPTGSHAPFGPQDTMAGDQAACVEWKVNRLNSRGKPIYLRKYVHHGSISATDPDALGSSWLTTLNDYAGPLGIQVVHGGLRSRSHDDVVVAAKVIPWVTTRTLKRRGKRPRVGS